MTIQSTPQVSVETLVGNQKHEYPKPSIPVEMPIEKPVTTPVEGGNYNGKVNEAKNTVEANVKNVQHDAKETEMDATQSLSNTQTLALKANTTQNKIDAYKAGVGVESNENTIKLVEESNIQASQQNTFNDLKDLRELQDTVNKAKGVQTYQQNMGLIS